MSKHRQVKQVGDHLTYHCDMCQKWFTALYPNLKPPHSVDVAYDANPSKPYDLLWFCSVRCLSVWAQKKE